MTAREWLDEVQKRADKAHEEIVRLCQGGRWTMRVPADPTIDSDLILEASVTDTTTLADALRAVLDVHMPDSDGDCTGCGLTADEEATPYPCPTVAAITDHLPNGDGGA